MNKVKTYTITDPWADCEISITLSIDLNKVPLQYCKEVCGFWADGGRVLQQNNNDPVKGYAAYCGRILLHWLFEYDPVIALLKLKDEEGIPHQHGIEIISYELPEISTTASLKVIETKEGGNA